MLIVYYRIEADQSSLCMSPNAKAENYLADIDHPPIYLYLQYLKGQLSQITIIVDMWIPLV